MKSVTQFLLTVLAATLAISANTEKERPYEFGFTIDGQQHRHEKRDERGIVQGEFGFITADGIYHVTVYATDENGKFKILKTRNIRISAPLDGSPFRGEISPEAEKYRKQAGLPPLPAGQPTLSPVAVPSTVTNNPAPFAFTTQPTVKPSCASCGYITTPAPLPGQNGANTFQFQNPVFNKEDQSKYQQPQQQQAPVPGSNLPQRLQVPLSNIPPYEVAKGPQYTNYQSGQHLGQNLAGTGGSQPAGLPVPSYPSDGAIPESGLGQNFGGFGGNSPAGVPAQSGSVPGYPGDGGFVGSPGDSSGSNNNAIGPNTGDDGLIYDTGVIYGQNGFVSNVNGVVPPTTDILPPIEVSDNTIHVGGSHPQDIPIKDKYPGMQDGLPAGINEKDITDLLYKFHFTVGFHGHYEKGYKNGAKIGGYFVNGRDGISRVVTYVADENGYRPKVKFINLGLDSSDTPKPDSEKTFGLQSFEFVWYPID